MFLLLKFLDTEKELSKSKIVTVCHGDVWSNNMLFTEDDESVTLIDFQMLGRVHPALDLWYFLAVNSDKVSCRAGSNLRWRKKGAYFKKVVGILKIFKKFKPVISNDIFVFAKFLGYVNSEAVACSFLNKISKNE